MRSIESLNIIHNIRQFFKHFIFKYFVLFAIGGTLYLFVELIWRHHTHYSMHFVVGTAFVIVGVVNRFLKWRTPLWKQMLIAAAVITAIEFAAGYLLNIHMGLNVWDYSDMAFNLMGQICLLYSFYWFALSAVAVVLDDYVRYRLFGEEEPKYYLW